MNNATNVKKFFDLMAAGKKAALDVRLDSGDVVCQFSKNIETGEEGNGTPGQPFTHEWTRVASCDRHELES